MNTEDYYVYIYLNQSKFGFWVYNEHVFNYQPFYVGKGRNKRDIQHLCPCMLNKKTLKNSIIKSIISKTGEIPIHYRIYTGLTNQEAIDIEIDFIKHFGRMDIGTGILANGTDGGDGNNNLSEESKNRIGVLNSKKVYQYSLDGELIKVWDSVISTEIEFFNSSNISTSIKRNGTCYGYIWSYTELPKFKSRVKYQMPIKYTNIAQIDKRTNEILKVFDSALDIEKHLKLRSGARNKIYDCINNKLKTAYGYKWKIKE